MLEKEQLIPQLLQAFPEFQDRWNKHVEHWGEQEAGSYNDMAEFVVFVIEDLYDKRKHEQLELVFQQMEEFLKACDQEARDVVVLGFFETLQCVASHRPYGKRAFVRFLGPLSAQAWEELNALWEGKSSLMDVIREERKSEKRHGRTNWLSRLFR